MSRQAACAKLPSMPPPVALPPVPPEGSLNVCRVALQTLRVSDLPAFCGGPPPGGLPAASGQSDQLLTGDPPLPVCLHSPPAYLCACVLSRPPSRPARPGSRSARFPQANAGGWGTATRIEDGGRVGRTRPSGKVGVNAKPSPNGAPFEQKTHLGAGLDTRKLVARGQVRGGRSRRLARYTRSTK